MTLKREYLIRTQTPQRVGCILNTHTAVDDYMRQRDHHDIGQQFAERIWPLLKRYVIDDDSVGNDEILGECLKEKDYMQESALVFCEDAFHRVFNNIKEEAREKKMPKAWRYKELACYLNNHPEEIDQNLLEWAEFVWNEEFASTLRLPDELIREFIGRINAEDIKETRHNREYFGYGGSYLEVPDWVSFLASYLETEGKYEQLFELADKLLYVELKDALLFRIQLPHTFVELLKLTNDIKYEYRLVLLSHWYREIIQEGATLRGYIQLESSHPLAVEGMKIYEQRQEKLTENVRDSLRLFFEKLGRNTVERWFYGDLHRLGSDGAAMKESETEVQQVVEQYLAETFTPAAAMDDFANAAYLVFLGNACERLNDGGLIEALRKGYENYLHSNQLYKLPALGDELLEILRGYSLPMRIQKSYEEKACQLMERFFTRHEGYKAVFDKDYNERVARECFVLSSLLLLTEDEDLVEGRRYRIFAKVSNELFCQMSSCWMEHLQDKYVESLRLAHLMVCQVWQKDKTQFENRVVEEIDNLYAVCAVLATGSDDYDETVKNRVVERWDNEHKVMYIRALQTHQMNQYEWLKKWVSSIDMNNNG